MKKLMFLLLLTCFVILISCGCRNSKKNVSDKTITKEELVSTIERLNSNSSAVIKYNEAGFIQEIPVVFYDESVNSEENAYKLLVEMKDLLGIKNPSEQIKFIKKSENTIDYIYGFTQYVDKIPVECCGISIFVSKESGKPYRLMSSYDSTVVVDSKIKITENQAKKTAETYKSTDKQKFVATECKLCISLTEKYTVAYNITVKDSNKRNGYQVYVDAITNEVMSSSLLYPIN